jgi:two-component system, LytTR family, sensor kinase
MRISPGQRRFLVHVATVVGVWTLLAFILTAMGYVVVTNAIEAQKSLPKELPPPAIALGEIFRLTLAECLIWAGLTLGIFWLARRFPFGQGKWLRSLAVHLAACFLCALIYAALCVVINQLFREIITKPMITPDVLLYFFIAKLNNSFFFYWAIVAVSHGLNYYAKFRDRELRSSQLEARLAQTQLQVLKMQLQPHFLFNTLNAISALVHKDPDLAEQLIARLGDLLRATLDNANRQEVSLRQELDFIGPYLEIEKARLGARLSVAVDVDPAAMDARVPNLILQPLVENAIRHGIAPRSEAGHIEIQARRENGVLHLAVRDDGPGLALDRRDKGADSIGREGIGLANTRARLEKLHGSAHRFELTNRSEGGLQVDIAIPFQEASAPSGEGA